MKIKKSNVLCFIIGAIIFGSIGVYAANMLASDTITYTPKNENWKVANVSEAIDSLYMAKVSDNYSLDEQRIGSWIDGKPLYRQVIRERVTASGSKEYFLNTKIPNTESFFVQDALAYSESNYTGSAMMISSSNASTSQYDFSITAYNPVTGRIWLIRGANSNQYLQLIVCYTKTTDQPES